MTLSDATQQFLKERPAINNTIAIESFEIFVSKQLVQPAHPSEWRYIYQRWIYTLDIGQREWYRKGLRYFFIWCKKRGIIKHSPEDSLPENMKKKPVKRTIKPVTKAEYERIQGVAFGTPYYWAVVLLWNSKASLADIVNLKWHNVDMDELRITIGDRSVKFEALGDVYNCLNALSQFSCGENSHVSHHLAFAPTPASVAINAIMKRAGVNKTVKAFYE